MIRKARKKFIEMKIYGDKEILLSISFPSCISSYLSTVITLAGGIIQGSEAFCWY